MKMLLIARNREYPLVEQTAEVMKKTAEYMRELQSSGKIEASYLFTNGGGVSIGDYDSAEEVWETLHKFPNYGAFNWTVEPVAENEFVLNRLSGEG